MNKDDNKSLLQSLREDRGLSATELADIMGVSKSTISKWEAGEYPSIDNLYKLARFFRITVEELLNGKVNLDNNIEYIKEQYTLPEVNVLDLIKKKDTESLVSYYETAHRIKTKYLELLSKASVAELSDRERIIYRIVNKYFYVDANYIPYKRNLETLYLDGIDQNEIDAFGDFLSSINKLSKAEREWEIDRVIKPTNFFNLYKTELYNQGLLEPFTVMIKSLTQNEKDELLNNSLRFEHIKFIRSPFKLALLESGANMRFDVPMHYSRWEKEQVSAVSGKITPVKIINPDYNVPYYANYGDCSYQDYLKCISKQATCDFLKAMRLRKSNPQEYYKNLSNGQYDRLIDF